MKRKCASMGLLVALTFMLLNSDGYSQQQSTTSAKDKIVGQADSTYTNSMINDYLALVIWMINRQQIRSPEFQKMGAAILDRHQLTEAKSKGLFSAPGSVTVKLVGPELWMEIGATYVDLLPLLLDRRGDFPPIQIRKGLLKPSRPFSFREGMSADDIMKAITSPVPVTSTSELDIPDGMEALIDGIAYVYRSSDSLWVKQTDSKK